MAGWFTLIAYIGIAFYTFGYSRSVWKQKKKFAAVCISVIAISLVVIPVVVLFFLT